MKTQSIGPMMDALSQRIKERRILDRMRIAELSELAGVSDVTISKLENGKLENITLSKLLAIANSLGLEVKIDFLTLNNKTDDVNQKAGELISSAQH